LISDISNRLPQFYNLLKTLLPYHQIFDKNKILCEYYESFESKVIIS
jgi:hypothetical protein